MGGQTALNLCIEADDKGIWEDFDVEIIGVDIEAINITEDRDRFKKLLKTIDIPVAPAETATSFLKGKKLLKSLVSIGHSSFFYTGGYGASFVHHADEFEELLTRGLEASPIHEVLIDKALVGWKEYELELVEGQKRQRCHYLYH
jgi:carbamoyl-phosphate synthase large subunit